MTRTPFNAFSTLGSSLTWYTAPRTIKVIKPTRIPAVEIRTGYIMDANEPLKAGEAEARTRAAHVDSAKDPKRSAPMPAMSPTLSPTLSAMVPGFRGESSGRPWATLPARSAPTSPKRATVEPPRPYPERYSKRRRTSDAFPFFHDGGTVAEDEDLEDEEGKSDEHEAEDLSTHEGDLEALDLVIGTGGRDLVVAVSGDLHADEARDHGSHGS